MSGTVTKKRGFFANRGISLEYRLRIVSTFFHNIRCQEFVTTCFSFEKRDVFQKSKMSGTKRDEKLDIFSLSRNILKESGLFLIVSTLFSMQFFNFYKIRCQDS